MEIKDNMEHLSSSQEATWPSSTNSFTAWGTPHAKNDKMVWVERTARMGMAQLC